MKPSEAELESVFCLGQCALSPSMMVNGELHAKVTPQKFDRHFRGREARNESEETA